MRQQDRCASGGCPSLRSFAAVCLFVCVLMADDASSLPPDFFRVGRHHLPPSSHWKRTESGGSFGGMKLPVVSDEDILSVVCSYCSSYFGPTLGVSCQGNNPDSRRVCTEAFLRDIKALINMDD